jgi:hypothetical protein
MLAGGPGCVVDFSRLRATQPLSDRHVGMRRWTGNRVDERSSQHGVENVNAQVDDLITTGLLRRVLAFTKVNDPRLKRLCRR